MKKMLVKLHNEESGQDLIEYALIAALVALVVIASLRSVGGQVWSVLSDVATSL